MKVNIVAITPDAEKTMAYCARVSNPSNQDNPDYSKLLAYCVKHAHWSIFEQANIVMEITTSRAIAAQILRHRSFSFQEFSQRYASVDSDGYEVCHARRQDTKNRQNSIDDLPDEVKRSFENAQKEIWDLAYSKYKDALANGIAKESARFLLPLNTSTTLYMNGTVRSWIHYIELRTANGTQLEHMHIAEECKKLFCEQLPTTAKALGWI
jgi:thymidylate synthase (FAD)